MTHSIGSIETQRVQGGHGPKNDPPPPAYNEYDGKTPPEGVDDWGGPESGAFAKSYPPPKVPANGEGTGGTVRVSTEALKLFAANLRLLIPPLEQAKKQIETVKIAPGIFYDAHNLQIKVDSGGTGTSIKPTTFDFLRDAIDAITKVAEEIEKLAAAYATAEELNAATGQAVGEHIENSKASVGAAIGRATS